jgi:hypothetical protein
MEGDITNNIVKMFDYLQFMPITSNSYLGLFCVGHVSQPFPWWLSKCQGAYEKFQVCYIMQLYLKIKKAKSIEFKL